MPLYQDDQGGLYLSGVPGMPLAWTRQVWRNPRVSLRVRERWHAHLSLLAVIVPLVLLSLVTLAQGGSVFLPPTKLVVGLGFLAVIWSWSVLLFITCHEAEPAPSLSLVPRQPAGILLLELVIPWCPAAFAVNAILPIQDFYGQLSPIWLMVLLLVVMLVVAVTANVRLLRSLSRAKHRM